MDQIWIIDNKEYFRLGFKKLIELRFAGKYIIIDMDEENFKKMLLHKIYPKLIIVTSLVTNDQLLGFFHKAKQQGSKIVLLSLKSKEIHIFKTLKLYDGFLLKNMDIDTLLNVLENIINDNSVYVHPDIGYRILQELV